MGRGLSGEKGEGRVTGKHEANVGVNIDPNWDRNSW